MVTTLSVKAAIEFGALLLIHEHEVKAMVLGFLLKALVIMENQCYCLSDATDLFTTLMLLRYCKITISTLTSQDDDNCKIIGTPHV